MRLPCVARKTFSLSTIPFSATLCGAGRDLARYFSEIQKDFLGGIGKRQDLTLSAADPLCWEVLAAAGSSLDKVVKVNVILVRKSDWEDMNRIYREYFKEGNFPARTTIVCDLANPDFLLEIECVAEA